MNYIVNAYYRIPPFGSTFPPLPPRFSIFECGETGASSHRHKMSPFRSAGQSTALLSMEIPDIENDSDGLWRKLMYICINKSPPLKTSLNHVVLKCTVAGVP